MSKLPLPGSKLVQPRSRTTQPSSRIAAPGTSRTTVTIVPPAAGSSRVSVRASLPSTSGLSRPSTSATGTSRPSYARSTVTATTRSSYARPTTAAATRPSYAKPSTSTATSRYSYGRPTTSKTAPSATIVVTTSKASTSAVKSKLAVKEKGKKESALKKFDRSVDAELKRRRDSVNVLVAATTSDANLLEAVDHLERAEAAHSFAGAVQAAEQAAATAESPQQAEEAAAAGARDFETELIDVVDENVPGLKPIQVIGYVGITRPTRAKR